MMGLAAVAWMIPAAALFSAVSVSAEVTLDEQGTQVDSGVDAGPYRLRISHGRSIYFLPHSAELGESALAIIAAAAERLRAKPSETVQILAYSDDFADGPDNEDLRNRRAAAVIAIFRELGIAKQRTVTADTLRLLDGSALCTSEYCRQSYRRVELLFRRG
jgi:outer membrane protein OmpA-like peptidoglycan-associated protein